MLFRHTHKYSKKAIKGKKTEDYRLRSNTHKRGKKVTEVAADSDRRSIVLYSSLTISTSTLKHCYNAYPLLQYPTFII
jgi:hypothetical protein